MTAPAPGVMPLNSLQSKLIHRADIYAALTSLYPAAARIEARTRASGGQVMRGTIEKTLRETRRERSGGDSLLEFRQCSGTAQLSLHVPVSGLDSLLRLVAGQTSFIENRQLRADDATVRHTENGLRNPRLGGPDSALAGASRSDALQVRQYFDGLPSDAGTRPARNLAFDAQAAFASISVELSQPDEVVTRRIPDLSRIMQPGAGD